MAASDKNIVISPQRGSATAQPSIVFTGDGNDPLTLRVLDSTTGSVSIEGSAGQLFGISNNLASGSIFSANYASGIPAIDVNANGVVSLVPTVGKVGIGTTNPITSLDLRSSSNEAMYIRRSDNASAYGILGVSGSNIFRLGSYVTGTGWGDISFNDTIRFTSTGNVGIGTAIPSQKLHVYGVSTIVKFQASDSYVDINLANSTSSAGYIQYADSDLRFFAGSTNTPTLTITGGSPGYVGIGTTTPQKPLEVIVPASNYASVGVATLSEAQWCGIHFGYRENNTAYRKSVLAFERIDSAARGKIHILNNNSADSNSATLADSKLTIQSDGKIGIGITDPTTKFDVIGNSRIGGAASRSGFGLTVGFTNDITFAANTDVDDSRRTLSIVNESTTTNAMATLGFRVNPNSQTTNAVLDMKFVQTGATNTSSLYYSFNHGGSFNDRFLFKSDGTFGVGSVIREVPYDTLNNGTLSWEGSAGQLFSITNNLTTGSIFSVNDVSGIPSIDVNANGTISLAAYGGNVGIGTTSPSTKLDVNSGSIRIVSPKTPSSASGTGVVGQICWDANYVYVCVATNTWKRSALSSW